MPKNVRNNNKGITLISLVVTMIVIIILYSITLSVISGDNDIITSAKDAVNSTEINDDREQEALKNIINMGTEGALGDGENFTEHTEHIFTRQDKSSTYLKTAATCIANAEYYYRCSVTGCTVSSKNYSGESYIAADTLLGHDYQYTEDTSTGKLTGVCTRCGNTIDDGYILASIAEVGQIVQYTPASKSYTSKKAYNGYGAQSYRTSDYTGKWVVLKVNESSKTVYLVSAEPVGELTLYGAQGYLYAEQELHNICKIYGYGNAADYGTITNIGMSMNYYYGGPNDSDDSQSGLQIVDNNWNSGGRALTISDVGGTKSTAAKAKKHALNATYYPTISGTNGVSAAQSTFDEYDYYDNTTYSGTTSNAALNAYTANDVWIATRGVTSSLDLVSNPNLGYTEFGVHYLSSGRAINDVELFYCSSGAKSEGYATKKVRAVVKLKERNCYTKFFLSI